MSDDLRILKGSATAIPLADESVQCIVTSPPYWGLRTYSGEQEIVWPAVACESAMAGAPACDHEWIESETTIDNNNGNGSATAKMAFNVDNRYAKQVTNTCGRCGTWRGGFGLEPTIGMYVDHTRVILRECWRVLRSDGVLFWNIGDSYHGSWANYGGGNRGAGKQRPIVKGSQAQNPVWEGLEGYRPPASYPQNGLKPKDLCLIPARVALAAQAAGWWVRSMILWAKPNPMPESTTDRPTDAYEHIIMLTKSARYFWDADAVREPSVTDDLRRPFGSPGMREMDGRSPEKWHGGELRNGFGYKSKGTHSRGTGDGGPKARERGSHENWNDGTREVLNYRNMRNVWMFATQPYSEAHFATFPEELPRRCILAATSARGACIQCGAPWERVTRSCATSGKSWNSDDMKSQGVNRNENSDFAGASFYENYSVPETIGWRPTCRCRGARGKTQPCVVLDPFGGSGTTGKVAVELGRHAVLLDLAYQDLQRKRTRAIQRPLIVP